MILIGKKNLNWINYFDKIVIMKWFNNFLNRFTIIGEFWAFLRVRKKWWLLPIIAILLLLSLLIIFAESSALAPFIYTIF